MSRFNLRQKPRVSYAEPEEPNIDEYIFCDTCCDYVFEYCAIHGPLLVIPDNKVVSRGVPSVVPRAALTIPNVFLHLAPSIIPGGGIGVFSSLTLPCGVRFGPYRGQKTSDINSQYCWQIRPPNAPWFAVDAADPKRSNWMRYVNCSRHWGEQNLVAFQYQGQLYYRTVKIIPKFTELMVFYGSEFAHSLKINLKHYSAPNAFAQKFGAGLPDKLRNKKNAEEVEKAIENKVVNAKSSGKNSEVSVDSKEDVKVKKRKTKSKTVDSNVKNTKSESINDESQTKNHKLNSNATATTSNVKKNKNDGQIELESIFEDPNNNCTKNIFICNDCNKTFDKKSMLIEHLKSHNAFLQCYFYCDQCSYRTVIRDSLDKHYRLHDKTRKHQCAVCGYRYCSSTYLKRHLITHSIKNNHTCDICDFKTNSIESLEEHLKVHAGKIGTITSIGDVDFACNQCPYKSDSRSGLDAHLQTHTRQKYRCSFCSYDGRDKGTLTIHLRTHTGEKPYQCTYCSYRCNHKFSLTIHLSKHTGEKPYQCTYCSNKYSQKSHLTTHLRTHTGEKPYQCTYCSHKFSLKCHLKRHLRTHTGEKPYQCTYCSYKSTRSSTLKSHMRTKHTK